MKLSRKQREMRQRRNDIISAAKILFINNGYENVTMEEIAQKSEFTRKTLYSYFKSKLDLVVEVFLLLFREHDLRYEQALAGLTNSYQKIFVYGSTQFEIFKNNPGCFKLLQYYDLAVSNNYHKLSTNVKENIDDYNSTTKNYLKEIVEEGICNKTFRNDLNQQLSIDFFLKSIYGIIHQYILHPKFPESCFYEELKYLIRAFIIPEKQSECEKIIDNRSD